MTRPVRRIRLAAVAASPVIYQTILYRRLATDSRIDLTVIFASSGGVRPYDAGFGNRLVVWDEDLLAGYEHQFLRRADRNNVLGGFFALSDLDVIRCIRNGQYDAVWVHGYSYLTLWLAVLAARSRKLPLLLREEQTLLHKRSRFREVARRVGLGSLFRSVTGLYIGSNNRDFLRFYGVPDTRLYPAPYCADNEALQQQANTLAAEREGARERFGIMGPDPVVLFVGKLVPKKDPLTLVEAFRKVCLRLACRLLVVGEGPLEQRMRTSLSANDLTNVTFAGFLNRSEIAAAYAAADIFCLPSAFHETWGMVVNEAMNFSLPIVVTDKVGCARDLVREGENGHVVPAGDAVALAAALAELIADPEQRHRYGRRSLEIISAWHVGLAVDGIVAAAVAATRSGTPPRVVPTGS
jgi:glycosyltransferase involved in cell wall biosynthesis